MRTFSFNTISSDYAARVLQCMDENYGYIAYFNRGNTKEAYQRIFMTAMRSENKSYTDLTPYIKVLARNIMKTHDRDIPYDTFNEEGEVAFVFTPLVKCDTYKEYDMEERVVSSLQEAYLSYPEDFMLLKDMIPCSAKDIRKPIKNEALKDIILKLSYECGGELVIKCIRDFLTTLQREKAEKTEVTQGRTLILNKADYSLVSLFTDRKWVCDRNGIPRGINRRTLEMEDGFNPELNKFRLAVQTVCTIWKIDCSDYFNAVADKIYTEEGVDNEYINWCGSKFSLITPAGERLTGISRETYLERVRHEVVLTLLAAQLGTIVAVSPDNIYLKLTKASNITMLKIRTANGKLFNLPMEKQKTVPLKAAVH